MSFKDMVEDDIKGVFLNSSEFASIRKVKYDGVTYVGNENAGIPILLIKTKEMERPVPSGDNAQGIHLVSAVAHIALSDMNGILPEQKQSIFIEDGTAAGGVFFQRYKIITSELSMGMIVLELEAYDE